ncbi:MAG: hypothetical protein L6R38_003436 [Xanthoria sp. 2 TBL-2021]|nr:MAG: hypothetical protein L6R38_003436 [Xanthoria sp. 2 TBL-2021]
MSTSLASQLAKIRVESTNALDLKAQKKAHSKSLLFDAHHAATQDFNTLFQLCYEGYQEICQLDHRFEAFAGNLFSDQSKQEDRTQMTAAQNKRLDNVLEDFMSLVTGRLLLKPAVKAMEWLVRRFSVHQYNTTCFVLTFLPYHTSPLFLTVLAMLPEQRPTAFKFLQPYIQSSTNPPRHTIVHTVAHNQDLFSAFNLYTLNVCRRGQQCAVLLSFWSSVTSEAVALMLDRSRLGRSELQRQNQEDVVMRVMPTLAEGLSMEHVPDLRVGCFMILTVLSSKTNLSEAVLTTAMDLVVTAWDDIVHAGLICLVVLSQQRHATTLPKKTFKALVAIKQLSDDLILLKQHYRVEKLVLGLVSGSLERLGKRGDAERLRFIRELLEANLMQSSFVAAAVTQMLPLSNGTRLLPPPKDGFDTRSALVDLLLYLADLENVGSAIYLSLEDVDSETRQQGHELFRNHRRSKKAPEIPETDEEMQDVDQKASSMDFEDFVGRIPSRTAFEVSFLSHSESYIFPSLADAFVAAHRSPDHLDAFSKLPLIRKSLAMSEPLYFSFFVKIWCGYYPTSARAAAIRMLSQYINTEKLSVDVQVLLPYVLYALADPTFPVRRAALELAMALASFYSTMDKQEDDQCRLNVLGKGQIYGQGIQSEEVAWLPWRTAVEFIRDWLTPDLEELRLDSGQLLRSLVNRLKAPAETKEAGTHGQKSRTSLRSSVMTWLCSHVVNTSVLSLKDRLLPMLNKVPKVGQTSTFALLKPLLTTTVAQGYMVLQEVCGKEHINTSQYIAHVMEIASPKDQECVKLLQNCISNTKAAAGPPLRIAAFHRLRNIWSLLKPQSQISLGNFMLDLSFLNHSSDEDRLNQTEALDTLRTVSLSTEVLQSFIEDCPTLTHGGPQKAAKRRRTVSSSQDPGDDIRRISILLEIVEASVTDANLPLVGGLFKILTEIQGYKERSGLELHYLELLVMNSIISILKPSTTPRIDKSDVRADVLVDCIRNSSSPQVQQQALLLVSILASIVPDLVIHNVMPIFTFMNSGIMKRTDDYSAHIVKQTMDSVIPRLMESLRRRSKDSLAGVSELLLSFAAAFEHVPARKRLGLFQSLMDMIGADEYLFALLILLEDKFSRNKRVLQFSVDLLDCYEAQTQFETIERYVTTIVDLLKPKPTISAHLITTSSTSNSQETAVNLLSNLTALYGDSRLVSKSSKAFAQNEHQMDSLRSILSRVMDQILSLSRQYPENEDINLLCQKLLDILLGGLPMVDFVSTIQGLLNGADVQTSLDALKSFELRLSKKKFEPVAGQDACLGFLRQLTAMVRESTNEPTRRVALSCVDTIVETFGKKDVGAVISATDTVIGAQCLGTTSEEMQITSLLSLSTIVEVSGDEFIAFVPQTLPKSLDSLNSKLDDGTCSERLHHAGYSFFSALLIYVPWAITGPNLDLLLRVSHGSANADLGESCSEERRATLSLIAKQVETKDCCDALGRTWANAMTEGPEALKEHLWILETLIGALSKSAVGRHSEAFATLLTRAFDLRRIQFSNRTEDSYEDGEVDEVEETTNRVAVAMIYKINDTIFRPIFAQLVEWAASSSAIATVHRQTTLYGFLMQFFDGLKSIVTSYAGLILEDAAEILGRVDVSDPASKLSWTRVLGTLQKCFAHDQDGFWQSPSHFSPISHALLDQLKHAADISLSSDLIPSITELAVAADSPNHHKVLNASILKYTRSDIPAVRLAAVQCQRSLTNRLGEEWLALLPEMLPFISELQEDDDETVERETLGWIKKIEDVLGESLTPMLQ